jgi:hypothetical protein
VQTNNFAGEGACGPRSSRGIWFCTAKRGGVTGPAKKSTRLSLLHRPAECAILQQPSVGGVRPIFDNQHSAVSAQHSAMFGTGFGSFDSRLPHPSKSKAHLPGPRAPLAHDDRVRRGDYCAARLLPVATLCRPDSKNEKTGRKLTAIEALKNVKMRGRQAFDRPFELGLSLCFQQNVQGGGVCG